MTIQRDTIISTIQNSLLAQPGVLALWLEGSGATGYLDEYSDIDLACSVTGSMLEETVNRAQKALETLGPLDLSRRTFHGSDFLSATFHLQGSSPYLLIDFDVFFNRGSTFIAGDSIEAPRILFDTGDVVRFVPADPQAVTVTRRERLDLLEGAISQSARIEKYVLRGEFLEAFGYYHKWLLNPLVEALRLRYTPLHWDYYIVHISRHLPPDVLHQVEYLFQVKSLEELEGKSRQALALFAETAAYLRSEINSTT